MIQQHCSVCGAQLNKKMPAKKCKLCLLRANATARTKPKPTCQDCGKTVFRRETIRCRACNAKQMKLNPPNPRGIGRGSDHPSWKGGTTKDARGYIYKKSPDHPYRNARGYVYEHRLVLEAHLGRFLHPTEVTHHINGKKDDNRIENLELIPEHGQHISKYHTKHLRPGSRDPITGRFV